jgi:c(7)-type cytochrome triheme protein
LNRAGIALIAAAFGIEGTAHQYGRVVLQGSRGFPAVTFDHFRHRARFTCRLCHVDVGFAMKKGATGITDATNRKGFHCGACHDGKIAFAACNGTELGPTCRRCHGSDDAAAARDHAALQLPRASFGEVDWQKAEEDGKVHPLDALEGVSMPRPPLKMDRDVSIESLGAWMTDVKFSHKKHAVWNGCEVCHPEIFPRTRAGSTRFTMFQIAEGESCGVCHGKVAFALAYCDRCHVKPVRFP